MLVYGKNSCEEILKNKKNIKRVYLERNFKEKSIIHLIDNLKINPIFMTKYELDELAEGNHQGIIIDVGEFRYCDIDEIIKEKGFLVILDHLEDTHNFGAIIRTCEAAGVDGIIIPKDRSVSVNSTVMKTSSGAAVNVKICMVTNLVQTINYLKNKGYWIYSSSMDGKNYTSFDYKDSTCIIIGNEGKGVSELVKKSSDFVVSIPMIGKINSLNASVAAGIKKYQPLLYKEASQYVNNKIEYEDLIQEGMIGLIMAINGYDERKNVLFSTYAYLCIDKRIKNYIKKMNNKNNKMYLDNNIECIDKKEPINELIEQEFFDSIIKFKNNLNFIESIVFDLKINGYSYNQISSILEIPEKKVDNILFKIRKN